MSSLYKRLMNAIGKFVPKPFRPFWMHPAGPKTIFFWAPMTKWGLVIAGLGDIINRSPEKISIPQSTALLATGCIWTRYSMVIIPVNFNLASVNALVGASIDEFRRPLHNVSTTQSGALAATGLIWTRYCLIIKPVNYALSICNFTLGVANAIQCYRAYSFQRKMGTNA